MNIKLLCVMLFSAVTAVNMPSSLTNLSRDKIVNLLASDTAYAKEFLQKLNNFGMPLEVEDLIKTKLKQKLHFTSLKTFPSNITSRSILPGLGINFISVETFSPDSKYVLIGSNGGFALLSDISDVNNITSKQLTVNTNDTVTSVAISSNDQYALTSVGHVAMLWGISNPNNINRIDLNHNNISSVAFSPDSEHALTGSSDGTIKLWDISNLNNISYIVLDNRTSGVYSLAVSPNGKYVLAGLGADAILWIIDNLNNITQITLAGHTSRITSAAFSPDGKYVLTGSWDGTARLWNITNLNHITSIPLVGHTDFIESVAFSPNGKYVLTGSKTARLWDISDLNNIDYIALTSHAYSVASATFSPDGNYILTGSRDNTIRFWNLDLSNFNLTLQQLIFLAQAKYLKNSKKPTEILVNDNQFRNIFDSFTPDQQDKIYENFGNKNWNSWCSII